MEDRDFSQIKRRREGTGMVQRRKGEVEYLVFPGLESTGLVNHLFSTRRGGVSRGSFASLNLSYTRGDEKEAVDENFRRIAGVLGSTPEQIVCSHQTHTVNVRRVFREDGGKGVVYPRDYEDVDGLITDVPGLILATFYADCVPLYLVDMEHHAIGLSHSGWRGTVNKMGQVTLKAMEEAFGTRPGQVRAAIGPSICQDCYEVSADVALQFEELFGERKGEVLRQGKTPDKFQLNLQRANELLLLFAGVRPQHLETAGICTCCNSEYLFSHRASEGKRGNLGAFLELRKS